LNEFWHELVNGASVTEMLIPKATRRDTHGWFGEPWDSEVCYRAGGELATDLRKQVPAGETCWGCKEEIVTGDRGYAIVPPVRGGGWKIRHIHVECGAREVLPGLNHMDRKCGCFVPGGKDEIEGMSKREEALEIWRRRFERTAAIRVAS
jgi:hypothetical protein